jgi:hypothetical protein
MKKEEPVWSFVRLIQVEQLQERQCFPSNQYVIFLHHHLLVTYYYMTCMDNYSWTILLLLTWSLKFYNCKRNIAPLQNVWCVLSLHRIWKMQGNFIRLPRFGCPRYGHGSGELDAVFLEQMDHAQDIIGDRWTPLFYVYMVWLISLMGAYTLSTLLPSAACSNCPTIDILFDCLFSQIVCHLFLKTLRFFGRAGK